MTTTTGLELLDTPLGGSALARAALAGDPAVRQWFAAAPATAADWRARAHVVAGRHGSAWLDRLRPAIAPSGRAAARLERVAVAGGVLVTTGQQPGLFGGAAYTWVKAASAVALADAIEACTGMAAAPLFWAATDDADFLEASTTWIATADGAERLALHAPAGAPGAALAQVPVGEIAGALAALESAAGSAVDPEVLALLRRCWRPEATIGEAYLAQLRALLEPLGMAVLDAAHPALAAPRAPILRRALREATAVDAALLAREAEIAAAGYAPQVPHVDGLSLVFAQDDGAGKARVPLALAAARADAAAPGALAPNVLLRPVVEAELLPTVAYVAGPGELAYFAQVGAVASALDVPAPVVVPRWSVTIVEPHVRRLLDRYELAPDDLRDPHAPERRLARAAVPDAVATRLAALRRTIDTELEALARAAAGARAAEGPAPVPPDAVFAGTRRDLAARLDRLERRVVAAAGRADERTRRDLTVLRGALMPGGVRQERALNLVPLLARHGRALLASLVEGARPHAAALVDAPAPADAPLAPAGPPAAR